MSERTEGVNGDGMSGSSSREGVNDLINQRSHSVVCRVTAGEELSWPQFPCRDWLAGQVQVPREAELAARHSKCCDCQESSHRIIS